MGPCYLLSIASNGGTIMQNQRVAFSLNTQSRHQSERIFPYGINVMKPDRARILLAFGHPTFSSIDTEAVQSLTSINIPIASRCKWHEVLVFVMTQEELKNAKMVFARIGHGSGDVRTWKMR